MVLSAQQSSLTVLVSQVEREASATRHFSEVPFLSTSVHRTRFKKLVLYAFIFFPF